MMDIYIITSDHRLKVSNSVKISISLQMSRTHRPYCELHNPTYFAMIEFSKTIFQFSPE
jgi:hypothetical protein